MPVAPEIQRLLDLFAGMAVPPLSSLSAPEARELMGAMPLTNEPATIAASTDRAVPVDDADGARTVPVRTYRPEGDGPFGALVWIHGGGWVLGDLDGDDGTCRELCERSGAVVVSVDYRLAPEHPFPAAPRDCLGVLRWVRASADLLEIDPDRVAIGGGSAGGNLAAAVALAVRGEGPPLRLQVLVYPAVDFAMDRPSIVENASDYLLTADDMRWFIDQYVAPEDRTDPLAAPMHAPDLSGAAPAVVLTAGYDPLRDEGDAYAERLAAAGVDVEHVRYDDMIHGFFGMTAMVDAARDARDRSAAALRRALA